MAYVKYDGTLAATTADASNWNSDVPGVDTLTGTAGADALEGFDGDMLIGLGGDDTYYVKSLTTTVVEQAGGGVDKIAAWANTDLSRTPNVENLDIGGDGRVGAGNAADNVIQGDAGRQQIYGGLGQDVLVGGGGKDVFVVYKGEGNDVIQDFSATDGDVIRLKAGYTSFAEVQSHLSQVGADVKIDLGGTDGLILRNVQVGQLTAANFQLQLDTSKLGAQTFHDEFSGPLSLWDAQSNPTGTWRPDYGFEGEQGLTSYTLTSNGEKQIYTSPYFRGHNGDFSENPFVSNADGTLSIWAKPSTNSEIFGYGYTSGAITTKETFSQTYGYFEMRADLPTTAGAWPAFWLVPASGAWPPELDVMETLTTDAFVDWTTVHTNQTGSHTSEGQASMVPETADGFHTYGALWSPTTITWYVDGVEIFQVATPADMNTPMYMIANMALGGWGGAINDAQMPAEMKIDYIRAYALAGGTTATPPPVVTPPPPAPTPPPAPAYQNTLFSLSQSASWTKSFLGAQKPDKLNGTGGSDLLDGGANSDTMTGGLGDDTYRVDRATDVVVENAGGGVDTVESTSSSYTLSANVENLKLTATSAQTGVGNDLANRLVSNGAGSTLNGAGGDDVLVAGRGADVLTGGAGKDIFQFDQAPTKAGHVTDFTAGQDMIDLRGLFASAGYRGADPLADGYLKLTATGTGDTQVWFDADGAGAKAAVLVTTIDHVLPSTLVVQNDWFFS